MRSWPAKTRRASRLAPAQPRIARSRPRAAAAFLCCGTLLAAGWSAAESLPEAILLAYRSNPALLAARADLRASDERYAEARAALGPTVSISSGFTQENARVSQPSLLGSIGTTTSNVYSNSVNLTVSQPIYSSGALSAALSAAHADVLANRESLRNSEETVLGQVIGAYVDVVLDRDLVAIARQDVDVLNVYLREMEARFKVRDATKTDLAEASARLLAAEIRVTQSQAQLRDGEAKYLSVVGQSPGQLEAPPDLPGLPVGIDAAYDTADRANPTLLAARFTEVGDRARVREAKAGYGFQVNTNFTLSRNPVIAYEAHTNIDAASATVNLTKQLFTGGLQSARVGEAEAIDQRDQLRADDARRQAILSVAQAWNDLYSTRSLLARLAQQLVEERKSFEGSRIEQRVGDRNTIDVLNAEQEYQDTRISLAQRYHDEYIQRVSLLTAMGVLQVEFLEPGVETYHPEAYFQEASRRRALPWEAVVLALDRLGEWPWRGEPASRAPLGDERQPGVGAMPPAPRWASLDEALQDRLTLR